MSGCYGNSAEDKYWSGKLDEYLDSVGYEYTGSFSDYDLTVELDDGKVLFVEICGQIENGEIVDITYDCGQLQDGEDSKYVAKEEIDRSVDIQDHADREIEGIIEWS